MADNIIFVAFCLVPFVTWWCAAHLDRDLRDREVWARALRRHDWQERERTLRVIGCYDRPMVREERKAA